MDSINKEQNEDNFENLAGSKALEKIKELADKASVCLFCTKIRTGESFSVRPMGQEKVDDNGHIWFISAEDSHKNDELDKDPSTQLLFQGGDYSPFMTLYGTTKISKDKQKIDELWDPNMKAWFTEGKDDPRISVLEFIPKEGYYWDTKHGSFVAFAKIVYGAMVGQTYDDSIEGNIKP